MKRLNLNNMNRNYPIDIESMVKLLLQRNEAFRPYLDMLSRVKTLSTADQICSCRAYYENLIHMVACHMFPKLSNEECNRVVHYSRHQIEECDRALRRLSQNALRDEVVGEFVKRFANRNR